MLFIVKSLFLLTIYNLLYPCLRCYKFIRDFLSPTYHGYYHYFFYLFLLNLLSSLQLQTYLINPVHPVFLILFINNLVSYKSTVLLAPYSIHTLSSLHYTILLFFILILLRLTFLQSLFLSSIRLLYSFFLKIPCPRCSSRHSLSSKHFYVFLFLLLSCSLYSSHASSIYYTRLMPRFPIYPTIFCVFVDSCLKNPLYLFFLYVSIFSFSLKYLSSLQLQTTPPYAASRIYSYKISMYPPYFLLFYKPTNN